MATPQSFSARPAVAAAAICSTRLPRRSAVQLTVFAAASLNTVMPQIYGSQKYSFAGSDALQAQIALGAPADVFLAASTVGPDALYAAGCEQVRRLGRGRAGK